MTLKEKSICWENFLLGKRIIETNPVIVQKKQIDDYNRNRKILDLRGKKQKNLGLNRIFVNLVPIFISRISRIHNQQF